MLDFFFGCKTYRNIVSGRLSFSQVLGNLGRFGGLFLRVWVRCGMLFLGEVNFERDGGK